MKERVLVGLCVVLMTGCLGGRAKSPSGDGAGAPRGASASGVVPQDDRAQREKVAREGDAKFKAALDDGEAMLAHSANVALGAEDPMKIKKKASVTELVAYLRAKKMPLRYGKGEHSRRETLILERDAAFLELNDILARSKKPAAAQRAEAQEIRQKWDILDMQIKEAQHTYEEINHALLEVGLAEMVMISKLYASRRRAGGDLDDMDYANVQMLLKHTHRLEALSALATGLVTAYRGVIMEKRDSKGIEKYAKGVLDARPIVGSEATLDEAKAYVTSLANTDRSAVRARYEKLMADLYGEEALPSMKGRLDDTFAAVDANLAAQPVASAPASASQPSQGSAAAPPGGGSPLAGLAGGKLQGAAAAAAKGDYAGAALQILPLEGKARHAAEAAVALTKGDYRGAIKAATELAPEGPVRTALSLATSIFG